MAVEAVIWDFGGVLSGSPFDGLNRFEQERGLPRDLIRRINATNPHDNAWARFERSDISVEQFDLAFAEEAAALGHVVRGADLLPALSGEIRPGMVAALTACKARFKVGCITNNMTGAGAGPGMASDAAKMVRVAEVLALFDAVIESSKVGLRKPDPRIYLMMCELLGVKPEACVYLDDLGINCKPAAQLGMVAIKVESEVQALAALSTATGLRFEPS